MTAREAWFGANQQYLGRAVEAVRLALERHAGKEADEPAGKRGADLDLDLGATGLPPLPEQLDPPPALATLAAALGLSPFDQLVLVLAAAVELEGAFPALCARAQGDTSRSYPTFGLALAALPGANWAALSPGSPLRYWQLVEVGPGGAMTASQLRIDEPILHYLTGVRSPDDRLAGLDEPVAPAAEAVPSRRRQAEELAAAWNRSAGSSGTLPAIQLCGRPGAGKRRLAAAVCARLGLDLRRAPASILPTAPADVQRIVRLWNRSALLLSTALLLDCEDSAPGDGARDAAIRQVVEGYRGPLFVGTRRRRPDLDRSALAVEVAKPLRGEQLALWQQLLGPSAATLDGALDRLVAQFDLGEPTIRAAFAAAVGAVETASVDPAPGEAAPADTPSANTSSANPEPAALLADSLWRSCRLQSRPQLEGLAERIRRAATWRQLVLPADRLATLREIAAHIRHRVRVYEDWGFAKTSARGLGVSALFAGGSGTGKTMAAEVLANELDLDLYRVDLSSVVSKYIGETEKNLARIFDAAENGGAILLFDEADALFGKRTEIRDSHDRYANVEVSYLLQRMESYQGLAILTTNMRDAIDAAFLRRLRFVVEFPFPGEAEREEIWRRIFPGDTPTVALDPARLARLDVTGGNIRNIALQAAFLAAHEDRPVEMRDLETAARSEFLKLQRPLPERALGDWS